MLALACLLLPFIRLRPNRVLTGQAWPLPSMGAQGLGLAIGMLVLAGLYVALPARRALARALVALLAGGLTVAALSWAALWGTTGQEGARISLGAGFLLMAVGILMMLADDSLPRPARRLWLLPAALLLVLLLAGRLDGLSLLQEYHGRRDAFWQQAGQHLALAASATVAAFVVGLPMAFLMLRHRVFERPVFLLLNLGQTIPTLSLLGLLMVPLAWLGRQSALLKSWGVSGVGFWPAWIALFSYCLFPIMHSALAGLKMVDPVVMEAARGMGMTTGQTFLRVRLPLAAPLIFTGLRTAMTQAMGNATLAALIGGGGLGGFIFLGLAQSASDLILLGTIPLIALTFAADTILGQLIRLLGREQADDPHPVTP